jgi:peptidoglycan/xylan/chitin deacetylase (PgdA/CDA1 family)
LLDKSGSIGDNHLVRPKKPLAALLTIAVALAIGADLRSTAAAGPGSAPVTPGRVFGPDVPTESRDGRTVALTFDDGPSPDTLKILAVLRRNHVQATFCMVGVNVRRYPAIARRVRREGHQLCNHSRTHANLARLSRAGARAEVTGAQREIRAATAARPGLFRFPYGSSDAKSRKLVAGLHLRRLSWDVDPEDWRRPAPRRITARIVKHAHPRCVVLLHDGGGNRAGTAASLDATIRELRERGYRFVLA